MALFSVALSAAASYQQSSTQQATAQYQAKVAANNAQVAEWQAADAKERGDVAAAAVRRKYAGLQGTQIATLAARGLDVSSGSANAILSDTDFFGDYDQRVTRANAQREAWGFKVRAGNFSGDSAAFGAMADATNPGLSAVMAGAGTYFRGAGNNLGNTPNVATTSGGGGTLLYDAAPVAQRWYG